MRRVQTMLNVNSHNSAMIEYRCLSGNRQSVGIHRPITTSGKCCANGEKFVVVDGGVLMLVSFMSEAMMDSMVYWPAIWAYEEEDSYGRNMNDPFPNFFTSKDQQLLLRKDL
ncbi:hypothetical protein X798_07988 [Onchocerca flexuosa]|uniref:Uncharacterized protein n=1 Tax=Onchocerca flexuosa TaxID=387005 RepID=A0A238BI64_9BILA|nr:hypothetical protein X798_07988 [Onchocerca flexuosa]